MKYKAAVIERMHYDRIINDTVLLMEYAKFMNLPDLRSAIEDILERIEATREEMEGKYYKEEEEVEEEKEEKVFIPATDSQKNYIIYLKRKANEPIDQDWLESLSKEEASEEITRLKKKTGG